MTAATPPLRAFARRARLLAVATFAVATAAPPLHAETTDELITCDVRAKIVDQLKDGYSETPVGLGVTSGGGVMELWTAQDGKTWTIIVTTNKGDSCVIGAGGDWMPVEKQALGRLL